MDVLLADHPALDLVGTVAERTTTRLEHLVTPADLADWLVRAGLLDHPPVVTHDDLDRARTLRESLHVLLRAATAATPAPEHALAVVNTAARGPAIDLALDAEGHAHRSGGVDAALAEIARAGITLLGGPDRARLRWCADTTCTHPFLDRSRAGRRRWCGMAGCGDRAKARAYRARHRS